MPKFRKLVENLLTEARIYRFETDQNDLNTLAVIKNPSADEYEQFKNSTVYAATRGIVVGDDVYVCDASIGTPDSLNAVVHLQILGQEREGMPQAYFEDDDSGNCQIPNTVRKAFPNLQRIFNDRKKEISPEKKGYFSIEKETDALLKLYSEYRNNLFAKQFKQYRDVDKAYSGILSFEDWVNSQNK